MCTGMHGGKIYMTDILPACKCGKVPKDAVDAHNLAFAGIFSTIAL